MASSEQLISKAANPREGMSTSLSLLGILVLLRFPTQQRCTPHSRNIIFSSLWLCPIFQADISGPYRVHFALREASQSTASEWLYPPESGEVLSRDDGIFLSHRIQLLQLSSAFFLSYFSCSCTKAPEAFTHDRGHNGYHASIFRLPVKTGIGDKLHVYLQIYTPLSTPPHQGCCTDPRLSRVPPSQSLSTLQQAAHQSV